MLFAAEDEDAKRASSEDEDIEAWMAYRKAKNNRKIGERGR